MLIAAFRRLTGDYTLDLYGTGTAFYERRLKRLAGNDQRIHFCGSVSFERMPEVYRTHDCIVVPSLWYETYNFVSVRQSLRDVLWWLPEWRNAGSGTGGEERDTV